MAVLVAIAIPVFTRQLEKSRESTDIANVRSAYGKGIGCDILGVVELDGEAVHSTHIAAEEEEKRIAFSPAA